MEKEESKFPIGKFVKPKQITRDILDSYITEISTFPERLKQEVENLNDLQLDTPYRTEGWTIRQVIITVQIAI